MLRNSAISVVELIAVMAVIAVVLILFQNYVPFNVVPTKEVAPIKEEKPIPSPKPPTTAYGKEHRISLDKKISSSMLGGGGRYVILESRQGKKVYIFDGLTREMKKTIPFGCNDGLVAANAHSLYIISHSNGSIARWDLQSGELTREGVLAIRQKPNRFYAGFASTKSAMAVGTENNNIRFLDPESFSLTFTSFGGLGTFSNPSWFYRISGDGDCITCWDKRDYSTSATVFFFQGGALVVKCRRLIYHLVPGPKSEFYYTNKGVYTKRGKLIEGTDDLITYPTTDPRMFLSFNVAGNYKSANRRAPVDLNLHSTIDVKKSRRLPSVKVHWTGVWTKQNEMTFDRRVFCLAKEKLLVFLPVGNKSLIYTSIDKDIDAINEFNGLDEQVHKLNTDKYVTKQSTGSYRFKGELSDSILACEGQYLLLINRKLKKIHVFNTRSQTFKEDPVPLNSADELVAADETHAYILNSQNNTMTKWNVAYDKKEKQVSIELQGHPEKLIAGYGVSKDLLLLSKSASNKLYFHQIANDTLSLRKGKKAFKFKYENLSRLQICPSANANLFGLEAPWLKKGAINCFIRKKGRLFFGKMKLGSSHILPGPLGQKFFTKRGAYEVTSGKLKVLPESDRMCLFPTTHPDLCVKTERLVEGRPIETTLVSSKDWNRRLVLFKLNELVYDKGNSLSIDKRMVCIPSEGILVTLPYDNKTLRVHMLPMDEIYATFGKINRPNYQ